MITKKEDLINTYIENDSGELRDLYTKKAIDLGLSINVASIVTSSRFIFTKMNPEKYGNVDHASRLDYLVSTYGPMREVTLSDLKPRTKTEFVKVNYGMEHFAAGSDLFSGRDLHVLSRDENYYKIKSQDKAVKASQDGRIYEKVETEIDERQEFIDAYASLRHEFHGQRTYDDFSGFMYDSGKFKLVE